MQAPWPGEGSDLLHQVRDALARYVVLPSPEAATGVVLWIAATHAVPSWGHAPRLVIRAPEKRCGKSRLLDLVEGMCHRPLMTVNASPSAVYRSIGLAPDDPPTLLLDEADSVFGPKAGDNEDLRGLLNAGHQRGRPAIRYDAGTRKVERIDTFAMAALAGIGAMPDTIEDRALVIRMRRRAPGETVAPYRVRRDGPALRDLRARLNQWARANAADLANAVPALPVEDRAADTWEPLIAIADLAAGPWPALARHAALVLTEAKEASSNLTIQVRLLADCRTAFGDAEALPTADLLERLKADPEAPWITHGHNGLTPMRLGNLLREFDISSRNLRLPTGQAKGYSRGDFIDAWNRYCPQLHDPKPSQPSRPSRSDNSAGQTPILPGTACGGGTTQAVPALQAVPMSSHQWSGSDLHKRRAGTAATAGTASPQTHAVCIACREPLTYDDGTHTHPTCETA